MKYLILVLSFICTILLTSENSFSQSSFDLAYNDYGLFVGSAPRARGLRINWSDSYLDEVLGINLTLWRPKDNTGGTVKGISIGLISPSADVLKGINIGGLGVAAESELTGLNIGLLGVGSGGDITGINMGLLGLGAGEDLRGISIAGLGAGVGGDATGVILGGLGAGVGGELEGDSHRINRRRCGGEYDGNTVWRNRFRRG